MPELILCANDRLARYLRAGHDQAQIAAGRWRWQPLAALTPGVWLAEVMSEALLRGEIASDSAPQQVLSPAQERLLWERAIAEFSTDVSTDVSTDASELFDREGLALAAVEAAELCEVWQLKPDATASEETTRFLAWRRQVRSRCDRHGWLDAARHRAWQIRMLAAGAGRLPSRIAFAGFDRLSPQDRALRAALAARGVEVSELPLGQAEAGSAVRIACVDRQAECRAAAAWAAQQLADHPQVRLGIVAIELAGVRETLIAALDDALHPEAVLAAHAERSRRYNVSLGTPLAREPVVAVALELLRLCAQPQRAELARFGALLTGPYWSAWQGEADGRARLDAAMRRLLTPWGPVPSWLSFARRMEKKGLRIAQTVAALASLVQVGDGAAGKRLPSDWCPVLSQALRDAGWPGERGASSREWQAQCALQETIEQLATLDALLGRIDLAAACAQLARLCRDRVFQPETVGTPDVEVVGPLEAAGMRFDALWVLGANDDAWPPPARPNPLLPAELQRRAGSSNASSAVQLEFARSVQRRLLHAAPRIVFSWARGEGDRALRPSPLVAMLPEAAAPDGPATLARRLVGSVAIEQRDDHRGPALPAGVAVAGGTSLLRAQALCPAWAFYRYRLGAQPLDEPVDGLDAADRGTLLHRVMERFFKGRSQAELAAMSDAQCEANIATAVATAFAVFDEEREEKLPPRFAALEQQRLSQLLAQWLPLELARPAPFSVVGSETRETTAIEGIAVDLRADRIDALDDGRRLIVDYKTGKPDTKGWEGERLAEPQLPVYATHMSAEGVADAGTAPAGVMFARVRADDPGYTGWGEAGDLVDGVKAVDWPATLDRWRAALSAIAREIRAGEAAVTFARADDLRYCDVLPLLRLPEVRTQMESE